MHNPQNQLLLQLQNIETFYGALQVHFDLNMVVQAERLSVCLVAMPAAKARR